MRRAGERWAPARRLSRPGGAEAAPRSRPSAPERVLYAALLVLGLVGLVSPGRFNLAPAGSLLEVAFLLAMALLVTRVARGGWPVLLLGGLYVVVKTLLFVLYSHASAPDFIQAYKAFFYLVALAFVVGRGCFDGRRLAGVTTLLAAVFAAKYGYSVALGLDLRPGVFIENNFELTLLLGMVYLAWPYLGGWKRNAVFVAVAGTVLISGSRSAALGLLVVYIALYVHTRNRSWPLHLAGVAAVGYGVFTLFSTRAAEQGAAQLDRLNFLHTFLYEVKDWPIWEWFTGSFPLTPLSPGSCGSLSFYSLLFSQTDPGVCYSVILHSYFFRVIFDHGLIGLVLLYGLVWWGLRRSGSSVRDAVVLLAVISISGLSVSAFNNVFVAMTLALAMGLARTAAPVAPDAPDAARTAEPGEGRAPQPASRRAGWARRRWAGAAGARWDGRAGRSLPGRPPAADRSPGPSRG